ncbi:MAG TPA: peptidylprolyl isomerase [Actinomycetota bacterium]|nr:peptidylprolyl isomerase [Actinomycetota bacterium]
MRARRLFPFALVLLLGLAACSDPPDDAAATVGEAEVSVADVALVSRVLRAVDSLQQSACGQVEADGDTPEAACNRVSLGLGIQFRLAESYAAEHELSVTDAELDEAAAAFDENFGREELEAALTTNGSTYEEFRQVLRSSLLQQAVARALVVDELGEDGLRQAYDDSAVDHTILQVDHILLETEEEAREIYDEMTAPGTSREDFLSAAERASIDPSVAENRGSLPSTPASGFVAEFSAAAMVLAPGEISEPVETEFGWHVIRLEDAQVTPYREVREDLLASRAGPTFATWMRTFVDDGAIEVNPRFGALDPQTLQIQRVRSTDPSSSPSPTGDPGVAPPS